MITDSPSQSRQPGATRSLTAAVAERMIIASVAKIAIPPPRGTGFLWYRSAAGFASSPIFNASLAAILVSTAESANEPTNNMTASMVIVLILAAPVILF